MHVKQRIGAVSLQDMHGVLAIAVPMGCVFSKRCASCDVGAANILQSQALLAGANKGYHA
jgi:hypothetical protein